MRAREIAALLLEREDTHRAERDRIVAALLAEQDRLVQAHELERSAWAGERAQLINAVLAVQAPAAAPVYADDGQPLPRMHRTEEDEVAEARRQAADAIQAELDARVARMPGTGDQAA